jgi:hypothetical protein
MERCMFGTEAELEFGKGIFLLCNDSESLEKNFLE